MGASSSFPRGQFVAHSRRQRAHQRAARFRNQRHLEAQLPRARLLQGLQQNTGHGNPTFWHHSRTMHAVGTQHQQLIYGNTDSTITTQHNEEPSIADSQELLYAESQGVQQAGDNEIYQFHGVYPSSKAEGICRIIYENVNGLQSSLTNNNKLMKLCDTIDLLQADIVGIMEHRINFRHPDVVNGPKQMFQREMALSAVGGHNIHECVGRVQEGGTLMMAIDKVNEYYAPSDSDKDPTGLGRWVSMAFTSN